MRVTSLEPWTQNEAEQQEGARGHVVMMLGSLRESCRCLSVWSLITAVISVSGKPFKEAGRLHFTGLVIKPGTWRCFIGLVWSRAGGGTLPGSWIIIGSCVPQLSSRLFSDQWTSVTQCWWSCLAAFKLVSVETFTWWLTGRREEVGATSTVFV